MWGVFVLFLMWAPDVALFFAHQEDFVHSVAWGNLGDALTQNNREDSLPVRHDGLVALPGVLRNIY